jgi:phosphoribosylamine-glycine ligase
MNILLLSNPTNNNVLATKLAASHQCTHLFIQANHPYQITAGTTVSINVNDPFEIEAFCIAHKINMVVIHQNELLQKGLFDFLNDEKRAWKGIVIGSSANLFAAKFDEDSVADAFVIVPIITDGTNYFSLTSLDITEFDETIKSMLVKFKQHNIIANGFLEFVFEDIENSSLVVGVLPFLQNEDEILANLETDLASVFAAIYNGTFEDVNIDFIEVVE